VKIKRKSEKIVRRLTTTEVVDSFFWHTSTRSLCCHSCTLIQRVLSEEKEKRQSCCCCHHATTPKNTERKTSKTGKLSTLAHHQTEFSKTRQPVDSLNCFPEIKRRKKRKKNAVRDTRRGKNA
jgi:hypothetical protein